MGIREAFEAQYNQNDGLISPYRDQGGSGNGLLYTATAMIILHRTGVHNYADTKRFLDTLKTCEIEPGLYKRAPQHHDQEGPDDYFGLMNASSVLDLNIAQKIRQYGLDHPVKLRGIFSSEKKSLMWLWNTLDFLLGWITVRFNYNNVNPGTMHRSSWLGRQPMWVTQLEFCCEITPPLWRRLVWCVTIATAGITNPKNTDSWILSWLAIQGMRKQSTLCTLASKIFIWRLLRTYPGGMPQVFGIYYFPEHPIAKYCPIW